MSKLNTLGFLMRIFFTTYQVGSEFLCIYMNSRLQQVKCNKTFLDASLLGCDAMDWLNLKGEGATILGNMGSDLTKDTESYSSRLECPITPLRESQISLILLFLTNLFTFKTFGITCIKSRRPIIFHHVSIYIPSPPPPQPSVCSSMSSLHLIP